MSDSYVFKRKNTYYFRIKIPLDILPYFERKEIWKSLKTGYLKTAKSASRSLAFNIEQLFIWIRSGMLTDSQIKLLVKEHLSNTLRGSEAIRTRAILTALPKGSATIPPVSEWRDTAISTFHHVIDQTKQQLFSNDFSTIKAYVNQALERNDISYDENTPAYTKLCREYLKAEIAISKIELERLDGNYDNSFDGFLESVISDGKQVHTDPETKDTGMMLSELIAGHIKESQQAEAWTDKTLAENISIYRMFLEIMGDIDISTITHKDLIGFRDKLVKLPANRGKKPELKGKSISQILLMKNVDAMSVTTVNKYLIRLSSLFKWAAKHSYITTNYAEGLTLPKSKRADQEREAYSEADIKKLLTNLKLDPQKPERYWIPLIALYQGMRLEEICQLHLIDIIELEGIPCFDISEGEGKKVKTLSSRRKIPIHPTLISLG